MISCYMSPQEIARLNQQLSSVLKELDDAIRNRFAGPKPEAKSRLTAVVGLIVEKLLLLIRRLLGRR